MQADFSLEDPLTFQEVIPVSQLIPKGRRRPPKKEEGQGEGEGPRQSATLLHEKVLKVRTLSNLHCTLTGAMTSPLSCLRLCS